MRNNKSTSLYIYILAFFVPSLIAAFSYYLQGIYPGGPNTVLIYDLRGEALSLYGYLSHFGPGYDNLFHWMSGGMGGGFIGSAAMYLSIFDIIFLFVPVSSLPTAIYFLLLLKIGLCGLFFSVFISNYFRDKRYSWVVLLLSCCYALMSYVIAFSILLIWIDGVMMLPLLALLSEKISSGKKDLPFIVCLSLCMIDDYYIAFMISISLSLYVLFRLIELNIDFKSVLKRFAAFAVHGCISAGIASFVLVPVLYDLTRGKLSENTGISDGYLFKNGVMDVFKMLLPSNYANLGSNQPPYIFCGSLVILSALLWMIIGKSSIRARVASFVILLLYFVSFILGPVDRIWHGFRDPIGFSCRYSFTFVFFIICFAARGVVYLKSRITTSSVLIKKLIPVIAVTYTVIELFMNSSYLLSKLMEDYVYSDSAGYEYVCDVMDNTLKVTGMDDPGNYGRLIKNFNYSCNDGALFGYDGLDMFTSSYNSSLIVFLRSLGINASVNFIKEPGITPPLANILGVRYYLSYWYDVSDYYTPLSVYDSFGIFENQNSLPFAYSISDLRQESAFSSDPFDNINKVYSDIFGQFMDSQIFVPAEYEIYDDGNPEYSSIVFAPSRTGHYWIYPEYISDNSDKASDNMPSDLKYLNVYVDGNHVGDCGFYDFRYCQDLGYMEEGREYIVTFDSPSSAVGNVFLSYYDHERCAELVGRGEWLDISEINRRGIHLSGVFDSASDVVITLPYDSGYRVSVNGTRIDPMSYRDVFLLIHLKEGYNEVEINYIPDGLMMGIIISLISLVMCILLFVCKKNEKNKN